jgi:hypothetical protein
MFRAWLPLVVVTLVLRPWAMRALQLPLTVFRIVVWFSGTFENRGLLKLRLMLPDFVESLSVGEKEDRGLRMLSSESCTVIEMLPDEVEKSIRSWSVKVPVID